MLKIHIYYKIAQIFDEAIMASLQQCSRIINQNVPRFYLYNAGNIQANMRTILYFFSPSQPILQLLAIKAQSLSTKDCPSLHCQAFYFLCISELWNRWTLISKITRWSLSFHLIVEQTTCIVHYLGNKLQKQIIGQCLTHKSPKMQQPVAQQISIISEVA